MEASAFSLKLLTMWLFPEVAQTYSENCSMQPEKARAESFAELKVNALVPVYTPKMLGISRGFQQF